MTDFRGETINIGDTIVYPGRSGSSLWMNEGVVVGFEDYQPYYSSEQTMTALKVKRTDTKKVVTVYCTERTCVIEKGKVI